MEKTIFPKWKTVFVFIPVILILVFVLYHYAYAGGLVSNCNTGEIDNLTGQYKNACNFNHVITLINTVIHFLLFVIATPLISLVLIYTGFLFIRAGDSSELRTKAKKIFFNAIIGYVIALSAWLIVNTILGSLGFNGDSYLDGSSVPEIENPTPTPPAPIPDDSGVLYVGGSYKEENPTGNTCSINLESLPIGPSAYVPPSDFGINKAFASDLDIEKQQAKERAEEFRKARCWLIGWYSDRKILNTELQQEFESFKPIILSNLENSSFTLLSKEEYIKRFGGASSGISTSSNGLFIKNTEDSILYISIHELTHDAESNGGLISESQLSYFGSVIFNEKYIEKYFSDFINVNPKYWSNSTGIDSSFFDATTQAFYLYCYLLYGQPGHCYSTTGSTADPLDISSKNNYKISSNFPMNPTEIDARLMEVRYYRNLQPNESYVSSSDAFRNNINFEDDDYFLRIPFSEKMEFPPSDMIYKEKNPFPRIEPVSNGYIRQEMELMASVSFSIITSYKCERAQKDSLGVNCTKENIENLSETADVKKFKNKEEAVLWMKGLIIKNYENLMNNSM